MNVQILRALVQSRKEVIRGTENLQNFDGDLQIEQFPPNDRCVLSILRNSFTDVIRHKISSTAYQRYSVKLQVIVSQLLHTFRQILGQQIYFKNVAIKEILREWVHPYKNLDCSRTFYQGAEAVEFTAKILRTYLTNELLHRDDKNINVLTKLANALLCLIQKKKSFTQDLERVVRRISELEQTKESEVLFLEILKEKDSLNLSPETVEKIYIAQRVKFIEEPIVKKFIQYLRDPKQEFASSDDVQNVLEISAKSPTIFQICCSILKEIFISTNFSSKVLDFIKHYLECLNKLCQTRQENILDLYPLRLQALIILLRISPEFHTEKSREHTINSLVKINESNPEETLILMTHFPSWIKLFVDHLAENLNLDLIEKISNDEALSSTSMIIDET